MLCPVAVLVALLAAGAVYQTIATAREAKTFPAPGQLVDVGGHRLHLKCEGQGAPVVVLDSGNGDGLMVWSLVQPLLARTTTVCAYDRAGYGWSEPGPGPRPSGRAVTELHALLRNAGLKAPFVLVGHPFGCMNVRLYASRYPDEVAGVVLVFRKFQAAAARAKGLTTTAWAAMYSEVSSLDESAAEFKAALANGATHTTIAESDHYIHTEQPQVVIDAVIEMLKRHP